MKDEKRVLKGYKIKDSIYKKAMKRAVKDKKPLANLIEDIITEYSKGVKNNKPYPFYQYSESNDGNL